MNKTELPTLPEPAGSVPEDCLDHEDSYTADQMRNFAAAAVAAERERGERIRVLAEQCAEWHIGDGDRCGTIARELLALLRA